MAVETPPEYERRSEVWCVPVEVFCRKDQAIKPEDVQIHFTCSKGAVHVRVADEISVNKGG